MFVKGKIVFCIKKRIDESISNAVGNFYFLLSVCGISNVLGKAFFLNKNIIFYKEKTFKKSFFKFLWTIHTK